MHQSRCIDICRTIEEKQLERRFDYKGWFLARISQSPNWYRCRFNRDTGQTDRYSLRTRDLNEAKAILVRWCELHDKKVMEDTNAVLVGVVARRYYDNYAKYLPSGPAKTKSNLEKWKRYFPELMVGELTIDKQEAFQAHLVDSGLAQETIRGVFSSMLAALNWAAKRHEITAFPKILTPAPGKRQPPKRLKMTEMADLCDAVPRTLQSRHFLLWIVLSLCTIGRPNAVLSLTQKQVDLHARRVDLLPEGEEQNKKVRPKVPICDFLVPWLTEDPLVGGYYASIKTAFRLNCERAGIPYGRAVHGATPNSLRHTMLTELRARGVPEWECAGFAGHRSPIATTTEIYAAYSPDYLSQGSKAVDDYMKELSRLCRVSLTLDKIDNVVPMRAVK